MDSFNIAVFASGNGSNLQSLLETKKLNNQDSIDVSVAVSYTHLTLPTICSV